MLQDPPLLILASGSASRRQMLEAAGIGFDVEPSTVDEPAVRQSLEAAEAQPLDPRRLAAALARAKAEEVSRRHPHAMVVGADQVLALDGRIYEKPKSLDDARRHLLEFRGRTHALHSAVALATAGASVWQFLDTADMTVRAFSPPFLDHYIAKAGPVICTSVGAYQLEGPGIQLFERIEGDYFTILGMPLLALLAELRRRGVVAA